MPAAPGFPFIRDPFLDKALRRDGDVNILEIVKGRNAALDTANLQIKMQAMAAAGQSLFVPDDAFAIITDTISITGFVPFYGSGTIVLVSDGNRPVFDYQLTGNQNVRSKHCSDTTFINQCNPGTYSSSCVVRIRSSDQSAFAFNFFSNITALGFHSIIRNEMNTRTTAFGQESNLNYCLFEGLQTGDGANMAVFHIFHSAGSGTGNRYVDFTTANNAAGAAAIRVQTAGCVCGDILYSGGAHADSMPILSFGAGMTYRNRIVITGCQANSGGAGLIIYDAPNEIWTGIDIEATNTGGSSYVSGLGYMYQGIVRACGVSRWEAANVKTTAATGAVKVNLFTLSHIGSTTGGGCSIEVYINGVSAGVDWGVVKAEFNLKVTNTAMVLGTIKDNACTPVGIFSISASIVGFVLTISVDCNPSAGTTYIEAQAIVRGGTFKLDAIP